MNPGPPDDTGRGGVRWPDGGGGQWLPSGVNPVGPPNHGASHGSPSDKLRLSFGRGQRLPPGVNPVRLPKLNA